MTADERQPAAASNTGAPREGDRFRNRDDSIEPKSLGEVLRWRIDAARRHVPRPPRVPTPRMTPDLPFLRANAAAGQAMQPAATWIGHATVLVQAGGLSFLTDPMFSERASPLAFAGPRRHVPPGVALDAVPHVDAVLVSHNHYDHLDASSVGALLEQAGGAPRFVVPLGLRPWFERRGAADVVELDWWQSTRIGDCEIVLVPAQHWSGRGLSDRMKTLWGGFAVFTRDLQFFFAGDTGYSHDFSEMHVRFEARHGGPGRGFDLALIPIGAYEPRWFMRRQHVDPREAVQIHRDVAAACSIGIHWGTFELTDESLDEPPAALSLACHDAGLAEGEFVVLAIGQTLRLPRRVE